MPLSLIIILALGAVLFALMTGYFMNRFVRNSDPSVSLMFCVIATCWTLGGFYLSFGLITLQAYGLEHDWRSELMPYAFLVSALQFLVLVYIVYLRVKKEQREKTTPKPG